MSRNLPAPPWLTTLVIRDRTSDPPVRRARIFAQATGQSNGGIFRRSAYERARESNSLFAYASYFEYAHRVVYRGNVRFPVTVVTFDDDPDPAGLNDRGGKPLPLPVKGRPQVEMIEGNHFIFRPAGTFHAVYIDDAVFDALVRDAPTNGLTFYKSSIGGVAFEFLQCGKDFDQDGGTTG
jgi:hypothetical protein